MSAQIDLHILKMEEEPFLQQALDSLESEPINLFLEDAIVGNTKAARKAAFLKGEAPYCSYIDPDDYVEGGIFSKLLEAIESAPPEIIGVYSLHFLEIQGRLRVKSSKPHTWNLDHHFVTLPRLVAPAILFKREVLESVLNSEESWSKVPSVRGESRATSLLCAQFGDWKCVPEYGYTWRIHDKNTSQHGTNAEFLSTMKPIYDYVRTIRNGL
jgi:hypothetical protein